MVPPFMNETANLVKLTTLRGRCWPSMSCCTQSNNLITTTYRPLEVYTTVAIAFAVIIYPIIYFSRRLEIYWGQKS